EDASMRATQSTQRALRRWTVSITLSVDQALRGQKTKQRIQLIRRDGLIDVELLAKAIADRIGLGAFLKQLPDPVAGTVEIVNLIGPHVDEDRSVFDLSAENLSVGSQNMPIWEQ